MNGSGIGYLPDAALGYMIRMISGLIADPITEIAMGAWNDGDADSLALSTEYDRDVSPVITWDGTSAGPVFSSYHGGTITTTISQNLYEYGAFTDAGIMPFYYASAIPLGDVDGPDAEDTTCTLTLAFKDSSE
jgi:hypothetical protein